MMKDYNESIQTDKSIYFKEFLAIRSVEVENLNECVIFELSIKYKRGFVVSFYRSSCQKYKMSLTF